MTAPAWALLLVTLVTHPGGDVAVSTEAWGLPHPNPTDCTLAGQVLAKSLPPVRELRDDAWVSYHFDCVRLR